MRQLAFVLLLSGAARAQGVNADWDVVAIIQSLTQNSARLTPIVEQITPDEWVAKGAPQAYVAQWESTRRELDALSVSMKELERDPEKLTAALGAFFRLVSIDRQLKSLNDGIRQYQDPAVADRILSVLSENSINQDRLQLHIADLAEQKEKEFQVVDREAQRCRAQVIRAVPTRSQNASPVKPSAVKP